MSTIPPQDDAAPSSNPKAPENNGHLPSIPQGPDWQRLVDGVKANDEAAMEQLYKLFNKGSMRYYLARQLGPNDLEDKISDNFLIVAKAIKRGDLREPERLIGYIRTVLRNGIAQEIEKVVEKRRRETDLEGGVHVADRKLLNPEQEAMRTQEQEQVKLALGKLSEKDREVLVRYYIEEQPKEQIIQEMRLRKNGMSPKQAETRFRLLTSRAKAKFSAIAEKRLGRNGHSGRQVNEVDDQSMEAPRTDRKPGAGRVDAEELLVMEILDALPLTRIPKSVHSDAVSQHTEARKHFIRTVLKERGAEEGTASESAAIDLNKARKDLEAIYSRKLYKQRPSNHTQDDLTAIESFLDKRLGKDAAAGFRERVEKSQVSSEKRERW